MSHKYDVTNMTLQTAMGTVEDIFLSSREMRLRH